MDVHGQVQDAELGRRDHLLARWCQKLWQTQERSHRKPASYVWPTPGTLRAHCAALTAEHLIDALAWIESAAEGRDLYRWQDMAWLDPPPLQALTWRERYAAELEDHVAFAFALDSENPLGAIFRRAKLRPDEADAARGHYRGGSLYGIGKDMNRQERTVKTLIERAEDRLLKLAGKPPRHQELLAV